jgi:2-amino-4-hydroxy-6-hydroxymethyldihydropteridine diphosphokinase
MFEKNFLMNSAVLSLGTNLGNRLMNLAEALKLLRKMPCNILKISSIYETAPWGNTDQPSFYNQVIQIETAATAEVLMENILHIEKSMGRTRDKKWEPRIIDIDILFFNEEIIDRMNLRIPHQHLHERRFILEPLNEILPLLLHPEFKLEMKQLLDKLDDNSIVEKLKTVSPQ